MRIAKPFTLKNSELYIMGQDNRLWRCLTTIEAQMVMRELHEEASWGHFATKVMQRKILDVGYWWPTLYIDVNDYCKSYDACHITRGLVTQSLAKLITSLLEEPWFCGAN